MQLQLLFNYDIFIERYFPFSTITNDDNGIIESFLLIGTFGAFTLEHLNISVIYDYYGKYFYGKIRLFDGLYLTMEKFVSMSCFYEISRLFELCLTELYVFFARIDSSYCSE